MILNLVANAIKFTIDGSINVIVNLNYKMGKLLSENMCMENEEESRVNNGNDNDELYISNSFVKAKKMDEISSNYWYLVVEVIDTGIGISNDDIKNLFKIFGKLKSSHHMNH